MGEGLGVFQHRALGDQHPAGGGEADVGDGVRVGGVVEAGDRDLELLGGRVGDAEHVAVLDRPDLVAVGGVLAAAVLPPDAVVEAAGVRLHGPGARAERGERAVGLAGVVGEAHGDGAGGMVVGADDGAGHVDLVDATVLVVAGVEGLADAVVVDVAERGAVVGQGGEHADLAGLAVDLLDRVGGRVGAVDGGGGDVDVAVGVEGEAEELAEVGLGPGGVVVARGEVVEVRRGRLAGDVEDVQDEVVLLRVGGHHEDLLLEEVGEGGVGEGREAAGGAIDLGGAARAGAGDDHAGGALGGLAAVADVELDAAGLARADHRAGAGVAGGAGAAGDRAVGAGLAAAALALAVAAGRGAGLVGGGGGHRARGAAAGARAGAAGAGAVGGGGGAAAVTAGGDEQAERGEGTGSDIEWFPHKHQQTSRGRSRSR